MNIIICIKQVPITENLKLKAGEHFRDNGLSRHINVFDTFAIEEAARIKDSFPDTRIILISMGSQGAKRALIEGLSIGADKAYLLDDSALKVYDSVQTAEALAGAIRYIENIEGKAPMIIAGNQSTDSGCGTVPYMLSELLDIEMIHSVVEMGLSCEKDRLNMTTRGSDDFKDISLPLPLIISMTKGKHEVRMPTFKRIREANRAEINVIDPSVIDLRDTHTKVLSVIKPGRNTRNSIVRSDDAEEGTAKLLEMLETDSIFAI